MAKSTKKVETVATTIQPIKTRRLITHLCGTSPFIMHRFAFKAWQELLYPSGRKNAAERASSLKHDPIEEYRGCLYLNRDPKRPTLFHIPNGMPHQAVAAAALDMPGATRASMERWTQIVNLNIDLYGVPEMFMSMVRNSDMNKTPDVRTRPIFPRWACSIEIEYKVDPLTDNHVLNLIGAAGVIVGLGDWRPQKGGPYGKFRLCEADDKEFRSILKEERRAAQQRAFERPAYFDEETKELMEWFVSEVARRRQDDETFGDDDGEEVMPKGKGRLKNGDAIEASIAARYGE